MLGEPVGVGLAGREPVGVRVAVAEAREPERAAPESMAPVLAVPAPVFGNVLGERLGPVASLGEDLDRGGDLFDLRVFELLAGPVAGERGVRDEREEVGRVAGRRRLGGEPAARIGSSRGGGSEAAEVDGHHTVAVRASGAGGVAVTGPSRVSLAGWFASAASPWPMPVSGSPWARIAPRSRLTAGVFMRAS